MAKTASAWRLSDLFKQDPKRAESLTFNHDDLYLDISKEFVTQAVIKTWLQVADQIKIPEGIDALFNGTQVNQTEQRSALHWLLRTPTPMAPDNLNSAASTIETTLASMAKFTDQIHSGHWKNQWNQPITDVVNIGVGGSDLGPRMCTHALRHHSLDLINIHFVSNIDGEDLARLQQALNPTTTLFIVTSKSFGTLETLTNAQSAKAWIQGAGVTEIHKHFVAVSSAVEKATEFGIQEAQIFPMWAWVGGRYSLWSAAGLSIMLAIGSDQFQALLAGAHAMDEHFKSTELGNNLPFLLAALSVYHTNGFGHTNRAIIPYDESLYYLPSYLQQLEMESNGKSVTRTGEPITYQTSPVIWGGVGSNTQHSFHQLLHQGTLTCPVDFLLPLQPNHDLDEHHKYLVANCLAQSQALMLGRSEPGLAPHQFVPGNKPSTLILYEKMTPKTLGALIALYEHKTYVASLFWNINAFDQWGVELGKCLANPIALAMDGNSANGQAKTTEGKRLDGSTLQWIERYKLGQA